MQFFKFILLIGLSCVHHESMDALKNIPKPLLVVLILSAAALFIMLSDPPKDACDAQIEIFLTAQAGRLSSLRGGVTSLWVRTAKYCKETKTLGGCAEFHDTVSGALREIQNAPLECVSRLVSQESVRKTLTDSMTLMVQMAWGQGVPEPGPSVYGWMGMTEFALFCNLKNTLQRVMLDEEWEAFVRKTVSKLPRSSEVTFDEGFNRSLFSLRCESVF